MSGTMLTNKIMTIDDDATVEINQQHPRSRTFVATTVTANDRDGSRSGNSENIGDTDGIPNETTDAIIGSELNETDHQMKKTTIEATRIGCTTTVDDHHDDDHVFTGGSREQSIPVGITIAYQTRLSNTMEQQQDDTNRNSTLSHGDEFDSMATPSFIVTNRLKKKKSNRTKQRQNMTSIHTMANETQHNKSKSSLPLSPSSMSSSSSVRILFDSCLIYVLCMIVPPIVAFLYYTIVDYYHDAVIIKQPDQSHYDHMIGTPNTDTTTTTNEDIYYNSNSYYLNWFPSWLWNDGSSAKLGLFANDADKYYIIPNDNIYYQHYKQTYYDPLVHSICDDSTTSVSSTSYFMPYVCQYLTLSSQHHDQQAFYRRPIVSDDMSMQSDILYIVLCSLIFVTIRFMILQYTIVSYQYNHTTSIQIAGTMNTDQTQNQTKTYFPNIDDALSIIVRCKSNHMLNSISITSNMIDTTEAIQTTTTSTNTSTTKKPDATKTNMDIAEPVTAMSSMIVGPNNNIKNIDHDDESHNNDSEFGYHIDISDRGDDNDNINHIADDITASQIQRDIPNVVTTIPIVKMNPLATGIPRSNSDSSNMHTAESDLNNKNNVQKDNVAKITTTGSSSTISKTSTISIAKLSRYSTAIFRCIFCTITSIIAISYFHYADFWPWYVIGFNPNASTKECWNLSGHIIMGGMDSDYDHYNVVLKRYFLWQASYHIHSTVFHVVLSILVLFYNHQHTKVNPTIATKTDKDLQPLAEFVPSSPKPAIKNVRMGSNVYVRTFIQHILSVLLIGLAYMFSSLRRLCAIGLFAFDMSSWSLHVLQIFMNAPNDSYVWDNHLYRIRNETIKVRVVQCLCYMIVIPMFIISRFLIWPTIWYSVAYESQQWLQQLEITLWDKSALLLRCIIHSLMIILHGLSVLYFYRLCIFIYTYTKRTNRKQRAVSTNISMNKGKT